MAEKIADRLFFVGQGGTVQKIRRELFRQHLLCRRFLCGKRQKGIEGGDVIGAGIAGNDIVAHAPAKFRRIGGARLAVADARKVRRVKGDGLCHLVDVDAERHNERVKARTEAVIVEVLLALDRLGERCGNVCFAADGCACLFGKGKKRGSQLFYLFAVGFRCAFAASVAADDRLGHVGTHRKFLRRAVQRLQIVIECFAKFHTVTS